ncbi:hypothetical protein WJX81_007084 [Elliptochloris bilobata]|uniref:UBX domain-containing protein n=1 Tax=Elliptochloris bilobata TaxID=381761 RepID=A0AAW1QIN5_9CHLO
MPAVADSERLARNLASADERPGLTDLAAAAAAEPLPLLDNADGAVRAPIPIKRDRLYGDDLFSAGGPHQRHARTAPPPPREPEAFRDFRAEGGSLDAGMSAAGAGLAGLFEPPRSIMFRGSFEEAKAAALKNSQWLLVNVQSNAEFGSHQLNRDTWRDETLVSIIQGSFVFLQVTDQAEQGTKVAGFYRLTALPAILIVDPVTGAKLRHWTGFVEAHRLVEDLVPFLDRDIHDPQAAQLANHPKRKHHDSAGPSKPRTEEEELAVALALSMEQSRGGAPDSLPASPVAPREPSAGPDAAAASVPSHPSFPAGAVGAQGNVQAQVAPSGSSTRAGATAAAPPEDSGKSAEEVAAEAEAAMPQEPAEGDPGACVLAVRFPDGSRALHRFPRNAPLAAVRSLCVARQPEAARGRPFALSMGVPGAPELGDPSQTLEALNLDNRAMLVMRWVAG